MKIVNKKIDEVFLYANNPRKNDMAVDKVAASIKEFGFKVPIVIDKKGVIVAGNTRYKASRQLGLEEIPCLVADDLTEQQIKAFRIADNKTSEFAEWDMELLEIELEGLDDIFTGFDEEEFDDIMGIDKEVEEDDFDVELPEEPQSKLGDIYQLGNHRLMCGDSTDKIAVEKLLNGINADMVFTDPPYGMSAVSKSGVLSKTYKTDIMNDDTNDVAIKSYILVNELFSNAKQVWWGANYYTECLPSAECWIVWDKNNGGSDQTDCELAWTNFRSVVRQFTMASEKTNRVHPTQKPVKLIADIFYKFDKDKTFNNILDLFGGSGSTLIACEQLDRICYMMELDEKYVDVIINRWEQFTGKKAELLERL